MSLTVALIVAGGAPLRADLAVELRAVSVSDGCIIDPKHVIITGGAGTTINLEVHALINGQNAEPLDDAFILAIGGFVSSTGGLLGDMVAQATPQFDRHLQGTPQDLDGDGDRDVGTNDPNPNSRDYFVAFNFGGASGDDHYIADVTWTSLGTGGASTLLRFRPNSSDVASAWYEDGQPAPPTSLYLAGPPVEVMTPEPGALVPLVLWFSALAHRRRHC